MGSPPAIKFSPLLLLPLFFLLVHGEGGGYPKPANCRSLECPDYKVLHSQREFEIREYSRSKWTSTMPIYSRSFKEATDIGFDILFAYIQGKNADGAKIEMTAPVLVDIVPSTGPFCNSTFVMHFYLPSKFQSDPPASDEVSETQWPSTDKNLVAVRRFGGAMDDGSAVAMQATALMDALKNTRWEAPVMDAAAARNYSYTVAGYNSPFEITNRINEVMFEF